MARLSGRGADAAFDEFVRAAERQLALALTAAYGPEVGAEATAEALAYAWEHWERIGGMDNPVGYLFRVGQSKARRHRWRRPPVSPPSPGREDPWIEPGLPNALASLSRRQRLAVVLISGFEWSQQEAADLMGVTRSTVQRHLDRGMARLRAALGVDVHD